jgi:hypothetical protein
MEQVMMNIGLFITGTLFAIIGYFLKEAFTMLKKHDNDINQVKMDCVKCKAENMDNLMDRLSLMIEQKLEAWWNKIENQLMNDNRLPPRKRGNG